MCWYTARMEENMKDKPDAYWREKLTPEQYAVLRRKGTERPFTGQFYLHHDSGMYVCAACGTPLFASDTKFDSDCGWPSFDRSVAGNVEFHEDRAFGMVRTEVLCATCGGHLGHVFDDGPPETTGMRFCINSAALNFTRGDARKRQSAPASDDGGR